MIPNSLLASPGDNVLNKYNQLLSWINQQKIISNDENIQITQTSSGQRAHFIGKKLSLITPLFVSQIGPKTYRVGEGYVNGRLPTILPEKGEEQPLVDPDGALHAPAPFPENKPFLVVVEITFTGSYGLKSVKITTKQPSELLRTGTANYVAAKEVQIIGHIPLAFYRKNRFIQFVSHNLQARSYNDNGISRVLYWPS